MISTFILVSNLLRAIIRFDLWLMSDIAMFRQLEPPAIWIELLEIQSNGVHDPSAEVIALTGCEAL